MCIQPITEQFSTWDNKAWLMSSKTKNQTKKTPKMENCEIESCGTAKIITEV